MQEEGGGILGREKHRRGCDAKTHTHINTHFLSLHFRHLKLYTLRPNRTRMHGSFLAVHLLPSAPQKRDTCVSVMPVTAAGAR